MFHIIILGAFLLSTAASQIDGVEKYKDIFAFPTEASVPYAYQNAVAQRFADARQNTYVYKDDNNTVETRQVLANDIAVSKHSLGFSFLSTGFEKIYSIVKYTLSQLTSYLPQLVFGSVMVLGICKLTQFCSTLSNIESEDIRAFASKEGLTKTAHFLEQAINKFNGLQTQGLLVTRDKIN